MEPIEIHEKDLPEVPDPLPGYKREWYKCPDCGMLQYHDYIPYSLSNPVLISACGHFRPMKLHEWMIPVKVISNKKKYFVAVSWVMTRTLEIEATSPEEAEEKAHQWNESLSGVPEGGYYAEGSFEVDGVTEGYDWQSQTLR